MLAVLSVFTSPAAKAQSFAYPPGFRTEEIGTNGTTIHVRIGGSGPAVVLLHGYGDTGDMWAPLAAELMRDHTVIAPDLRGMGLSATATDGFTKKNQAEDVAGVLDALHIRQADVVGHDIGNMVAFAFAVAHQDRTTRLVMMDAPVPGVGPWDEILKNPLLWHFRFGGPDMERLVAGRERIYLDRFWNEFSADPGHFPEASRQHYAELYASPGRMHAGFAQFAAFDQDAIDNRAFLARGRLQMPVLAIGGDHSFGSTMAFVDAVRRGRRARGGDRQFGPLADGRAARPHDRGHSRLLAKRCFECCLAANAPDGGSGRRDSAQRRRRRHVWTKRRADHGLIRRSQCAGACMRLKFACRRTRGLRRHRHRDNRTAIVVSGEWHFGYGEEASEAATTTLGPGGFYTEPASVAHFAFTGNAPTVVYITGQGPVIHADTKYVNPADDPAHH